MTIASDAQHIRACMRPTRLETLGNAMVALSGDVVSDDGVASAAILEAGQRLLQLHADLALVLPELGLAALMANRRTKAGRAFRAAHDRLAAEVLA